MTEFNWEKILTNHPVRGRGATPYLKRRVMEQLGNRKRLTMKRINHAFVRVLSIAVAIIVSVFVVKGAVQVQSDRANTGSQLGGQTWNPSPMFTLPVNLDTTVNPSTRKNSDTGNHTVQLQFEGFKGNVAFTTRFPISTTQQKYDWYFWLPGLSLDQAVSITGISQQTGQKIKLTRGTTLGGRDGSTVTFGTAMSFPYPGLWKVDVTVGGTPLKTLVVNVGPAKFDQMAAEHEIYQLKPQFFSEIHTGLLVQAVKVDDTTYDVTITQHWESHGIQKTHFWVYKVTPGAAEFLKQGGTAPPQNVPL